MKTRPACPNRDLGLPCDRWVVHCELEFRSVKPHSTEESDFMTPRSDRAILRCRAA